MIQKLRKQFILVAMCSTMAVLIVIIGSLNVVNYWNMIRQKDEILEILASNNGTFPEMFGQKRMNPEEDPPEPPKGDKGKGDKMPTRPDNFFDRMERERFSRETAYETRFFSVTLDESCEVKDTDLGMIASVEEDMAVSYASSILSEYQKTGSSKGFLDEYRYLVTKKDSSYLIVFVDCASDLQGTRKALLSSLAVSAAGILAVFLLVVFFSRKVFRPVEESYQKQRQFITDASHELKTPLTIISANVEVLEMESDESQWSKSIKKQIDRMVGLVEQMVTRMEAGESFDRVIAWGEENKLKIAHRFTVDDLKYLKAGGRVSNAAALVGGTVAVLSLPAVLGFNLWAHVRPMAGKTILDFEDFIVSQNLLPLGALAMTIFCFNKYGWGRDKFIAGVEEGQGWRFPKPIVMYWNYVLPLIIILVFIMGYYNMFVLK